MCVKKTTNKQTKQMCKKSSQTSQEQLVSELQTSFYYHHFGSDITWNQHLFCVCVASIFCNICVWVGPRQFGQVNVWCVTTKMLVKWGWHIMFFKMYAFIELKVIFAGSVTMLNILYWYIQIFQRQFLVVYISKFLILSQFNSQ